MKSVPTLLQRSWKEQLTALLNSAREHVLISSPFITSRGIDFLKEHTTEKIRKEGEISILTNLSPSNVVQGATSPTALQSLSRALSASTFYHLPRLHAKVYVADTHAAIVTSANLTAGGLERNYEYGIGVKKQSVVEDIQRDVRQYAELGAAITIDQLAAYCQAADEAEDAHKKQQRTANQSAQRHFEEALQAASDELIRARLAQGSVTRIFEKTVLYLLRREGPMRTREIHPQLREIHPDLCDDSVDRVIDGERFGKKWKHSVRTAQQHLKKRGEIELIDKHWRLRRAAETDSST